MHPIAPAVERALEVAPAWRYERRIAKQAADVAEPFGATSIPDHISPESLRERLTEAARLASATLGIGQDRQINPRGIEWVGGDFYCPLEIYARPLSQR